MDIALLEWVQQHLRSSNMDHLMRAFTYLADNGALWLTIAGILTGLRRYRRAGITMFAAIFIEFVTNNLLLKNIIRRPRPFEVMPLAETLIRHPGSWSMPSGHTAVSFAAATVLFAFHKKWGAWAFVLAALIGFSRIYLYVHYPSDVLVGAAVGILCGLAGIGAVKKIAKAIAGKANPATDGQQG